MGALKGYRPLVSITAATEYLTGGTDRGINTSVLAGRLAAFMAITGGSMTSESVPHSVRLMLVNGLKFNDANIVGAGTEAGAMTLTADNKVLNRAPSETQGYSIDFGSCLENELCK